MGKPVRVLHVIAGMGSGGAEAFLMNMYRHTDRTKVQYDFLLRSDENFYRDELEALGSRVYYTASFPRHFIKNYFQVRKILKENRYDIVHVHANALYYVTALVEAKRQGISCRIMHSHSTSSYFPQFQFVHELIKKRVHSLASHCLACSDTAGKWMFDSDYEILHNAIALSDFEYSETARTEVRQELGISEDAFVLGHVGHFFSAKNHSFSMDVFNCVVQKKPNACLVLVGDGGLKAELQQLAKQYKIENRVIFAGIRKDVGRVMSSFDAFVFPSLFEGLGIVAIEAQANGMQTFASEAVPIEAELTPLMHRLSLELGPEAWADKILDANCTRRETQNQLRQAGYDISLEAKKLETFYLTHSRQQENDL